MNYKVGIYSSSISGIIHPQITVVGCLEKEDATLKVYGNDKLLSSTFYSKDTGHFVNNTLLNNKIKIVKVTLTVDNTEKTIAVRKNKLILRILNGIYVCCHIDKIDSKQNIKKFIKSIVIKFYNTVIKFNKIKYLPYMLKNNTLFQKEYNRLFYNGIIGNDYCAPYDAKKYRKWFFKNKVKKYQKFSYNPLISILVPVYNTEVDLLRKCLDSVLEQSYTNFELCITDDCSTLEETKQLLKEYEKKDKRVKVNYRKENGHIARATNDALNSCKGEFIGLLDSDDLLCKDALYEVVKVLNENKDLSLIYTDEDKVDMDEKISNPFFKPDFSPHFLLSGNYICHFSVYRTSIAKEIGGFRHEYVGAQDFDFVLRFILKVGSKGVYHIPKMLYHWRMAPGSTAESIDNKGYAVDAGKRAIDNFLKEVNTKADITVPIKSANYFVDFTYEKEPLVTIVINLQKDYPNLDKCLASIYKNLEYKRFEVLLIAPKKDKSLSTKKYPRLKVVYSKINFQEELNNIIYENAKGEYLLFLDSNMEIKEGNILNVTMGYALKKDNGAVGVKVLYNDALVKSIGLAVGNNDVYYRLSNFSPLSYGPYGLLLFQHECSVISPDYLLLNKSKFKEVGGFSSGYVDQYSYYDLCLKLLEKKYYNVMIPKVAIYYNLTRKEELKSIIDNSEKITKDKELFAKTWGNYKDKYYNSNLSFKKSYAIARKKK